ncbi:MAG: glycosyltransferase family 2 protein [candidate division FCPU426 bacterium]
MSKLQRKPDISAFFPAYNEEGNIVALATKTAGVLKRVARKWEVIVVNDGSRDRTAEVVKGLSKKMPGVRLVDHVVNQGYGAAVKSGFKAARYEWIFFTDGDGQFDVEEIGELLPLLERHDLVVGYRIHRADPLQRKLNAKAWGLLVKTLFMLRGVRDIDCAFKFVRKDVFEKFKLETEGAMISAELLVKSQKNGFRIAEIGVHHYPRQAGQQTGAKLSVIARAFKELFFYAWKWYRNGFH